MSDIYREAFENWVIASTSWGIDRIANGQYRLYETQLAWQAWQADQNQIFALSGDYANCVDVPKEAT